MSQNKKLLLDLGPLLVFFAVYLKFDLIYASAALVVATLVALAVGYTFTKKISYMQLVTAALVVVFGGLTFYFKDPIYLKIKVSIINVLFGFALLIGLRFKKLFLKTMLGEALNLPDDAWRMLTLRWAFFFFGLALLNILIWFYSEPLWVNFKVFGILGLTALFAVANAPYMAKHMIDEQPEK
jgi:intracellular septation protein